MDNKLKMLILPDYRTRLTLCDRFLMLIFYLKQMSFIKTDYNVIRRGRYRIRLRTKCGFKSNNL